MKTVMASESAQSDQLLRIRDLKMHFKVAKRRGSEAALVKAVDGVDLVLHNGDALGLVGETGCGKTTLGRCIVRAYEPTSGEILFHTTHSTQVDLASLPERKLKPFRRDIRMVFQDPHSSLNPRMTLLQIIGEPLKVNGIARGRDLEERVGGLLRRVGLQPEYLHHYPHAFSGGQRQRVSIARALATDPRLLVADEPVSALDASVRAQILNLLEDLKEELDLTYIVISHDLSMVEYLCDRVAVMYLGRVVELGPTDEVYSNPEHPYTEALLSAVPRPAVEGKGRHQRVKIKGSIPDASDPPQGCHFHTRCIYAEDVCAQETPPLTELSPGHWSACHFADALDLAGV